MADAGGGTALADGRHGGHGDMVMRCEMVDECALTWTIGGVEMSPEAHCAAAASLLDREGAKQEHIVAVLHAWRSTAAHRWHVINALRSARWSAPSAKAAAAISAPLEALGAQPGVIDKAADLARILPESFMTWAIDRP